MIWGFFTNYSICFFHGPSEVLWSSYVGLNMIPSGRHGSNPKASHNSSSSLEAETQVFVYLGSRMSRLTSVLGAQKVISHANATVKDLDKTAPLCSPRLRAIYRVSPSRCPVSRHLVLLRFCFSYTPSSVVHSSEKSRLKQVPAAASSRFAVLRK